MWGINNFREERGSGKILRDPQAHKEQTRVLPYDVNTRFQADVPNKGRGFNNFGGPGPRSDSPFGNKFPSPSRGPRPWTPQNNFGARAQSSFNDSSPFKRFDNTRVPFHPPNNDDNTLFPPTFDGLDGCGSRPPVADTLPFNPTMAEPPKPVPLLSIPPPFPPPSSSSMDFGTVNDYPSPDIFAPPLLNHVPAPPPPLMSLGFGDPTMDQNSINSSPLPPFDYSPAAGSSAAVFTNDQQPPFAFPDKTHTQIRRNPGGPTVSKLMQLASYGATAGDQPIPSLMDRNNGTPTHSRSNSLMPCSDFRDTPPNQGWERPIRSTGLDSSSSPIPSLLPNPLYEQGLPKQTLRKKNYNPNLPEWMQDDDENESESARPPLVAKKKQEFDWKRSSFLRQLDNNNPINRNSNSNANGNSFRAQTQSQMQSQAQARTNWNSPNHPKSLVRNPVSNGRGNQNPNLIPVNPQKQALLPTPKLIPYPPPPLPKKPVETVSRVPKGILKPQSSYNNFVREGEQPEDDDDDDEDTEGLSVVPYEDDEDEVEFVGEQPGKKSSAKSTEDSSHDFFSEKIVQHFSSILANKPMEAQLEELLNYLVLSPDFLNTRVSIVRNLHVILSETFKKCSLHPYGADFIGIGNIDDAVNVFIDLNGKHGASSSIDGSNIEASALTKENVDELQSLIQEDKRNKFFGQIVRRTNFNFYRRNLPVFSFIHSDTKVRCNIRLDNYLLVQEAKVIQFICSLDLRLPPILALLRYWSSVHKVLDTPEEDTKNRFATLLMLFFLAQKKIIPTMAHIQSLAVNREYFENMEISYCDDFSLVPKNENDALDDKAVFTLSTLSILKQFFVMFATAKLEDEVVSLWKAEFIPKENFSPDVEGKLLPPDLRKKYRYGANGKLRDKRLDCGSILCIQDFQDLTENLSLAVAEYDVKKFQIECGIAHKKIDEIIMGSGNLMDLFVITEYADSGDAAANVKGYLRKVSDTG